MNDNDRLHHAGDILKVIFNRIVPENAARYSRFFSGWAKMAGEETAFHVRPKDIVNGILVLESDHPGWSQRIKMREEGLLSAIQRQYPELGIKRLRVVIGRGEHSPSKTPVKDQLSSQGITEKKDTPEKSTGEDEAFFALLDKFKRNADS